MYYFIFSGEADLVVHHIKKLRNSGVLDKDIAVIAPYSLQVHTYVNSAYMCVSTFMYVRKCVCACGGG